MHASSPHSAEVLPTQTPGQLQTAVERAAELLRAGELVGLPTETVYGLAANALDAEAVSHIYQAKGRPSNNPIIVHVASAQLAAQCVAHWTALAEKLARAFWPGPLTLVLPKAAHIPEVVTAGGPTVGIRWPSHPVIQAVIQKAGLPLAAPSANTSNGVSPTTAGHVFNDLGSRIPLILDGGACQVGIESTVLDISVFPPRLLRPGMIDEQALLAVTGELAFGPAGSGTLKSPGMLRKHYSPKARLVLCSWASQEELLARCAGLHFSAADTHILAHTHLPATAGFGHVTVLPREPQALARILYAELHRCDEAGAKLILVEALPTTGRWRGIADRLHRAAAA